ncbi:MAG: VanZ family protein [Thermodesulfobacteriota bacterium]|nr:VanZ family protein [Thermodesulfobacteriota bacterium]
MQKSILLPLLYMAFIFAASSIPGGRETGGVFFFLRPKISNLLHIPAYGLLFILWHRYFSAKTPRAVIYSFGVATVCGMLNEFWQLFVPNRYPSMLDIMLNTLGASLGFIMVRAGILRPAE